MSLLAIYLNDHLAGATVGLELARRAAGSNRGTSYGPFLDDLAAEIREDRESLLETMRSLHVGVDRVKVTVAWAAEKLGRLKLNGQLRGYSPLSRLVELEALTLGVTGKLAMWRALDQLEPDRPELANATLQNLIGRAQRQLAGLEEQRRNAVAEALTTDAGM
jgi:hypothetical protein